MAGGLLLVLIALDLLRPQDTGPRPGQTGNVAFVPLGTPLLAGPGAIATKIRPAPRGSGRLRGAPASV